MLDNPDVVFARIAGARGLLDEEQVETLFGVQALDRMRGVRRSIATLCIVEGMLSRTAAASVTSAARYYLVRQADKQYGKVIAARGLVPTSLIEGLLEDQRRFFQEKRVLQRLSKILLGAGAISPDDDAAAKREVLGQPATEEAVAAGVGAVE